ncbi:MAG: PspC domain-containing protein [Coriobacteriia bacterium]|nr:PspC domain-containing protein [Coriobacteriia bacterium]
MADKTLYRSGHDRMAGGVCAGIADYFDLDPTVVRLLTVFVTLLSSGGAIIAYIVLWAVVPEEPGAPAERGLLMSEDTTFASGPDQPPPAPVSSAPPRPPAVRGSGSVWIGLALVFVGLVLLVQMFVPQVRLWAFWPVVLIVWGLVVIFRPRGSE